MDGLGGPLLKGWAVFHAVADPRDGTIYAATNSFVYGATVHRSQDRGETWTRAEELGAPGGHRPHTGEDVARRAWARGRGRAALARRRAGRALPNGRLRARPGRRSTEPRPARDPRQVEPGRRRACAATRSQLDPDEPERMYVGDLRGRRLPQRGRRRDRGTPANSGVAADFFPDNPFPEVGQCVHKLLVHPARPERLWQQNHCGVYRSDDRGAAGSDSRVTGSRAASASRSRSTRRDPDTAFVIPEEGAENRVTPDGAWASTARATAAQSWELLDRAGCRNRPGCAVLREASSFDDGRRLLRDAERLGLRRRATAARRGSRPRRSSRRSSRSRRPTGGSPPPVDARRRGRRAAPLRGRGGDGRLPRSARCPSSNLVFDERGELRQLVNVYVDGVDVRERDGHGHDASTAARRSGSSPRSRGG